MEEEGWEEEEEYSRGGRRRRMMCIYRACRSIKKRENSLLYNALRSIYEDSVFVSEISGIWPDLPLIANLRCGLWYSSRFDATCYFKSTDGHTNNCSFSTSRLNLHTAQIAGQKGGCIIVDSARKGKRFPDSMSKTIPIWACVLNRSIHNHRLRHRRQNNKSLDSKEEEERDSSTTCLLLPNCETKEEEKEDCISPCCWDCDLHLPLWVPNTEKSAIEDRLDEWTKQLEACGADIASLASLLKKPLRPLWISQNTLIWLNQVPHPDSWDFTPIILVSASQPNGTIQHRTNSNFSWRYIPGAGDDEESWARGLSPTLFWKHAFHLIDSGPDPCNHKVSEIVEKERVYHAHRGQFSPQVTVEKPNNLSTSNCQLLNSQLMDSSMSIQSSMGGCSISWIGSTNIAVGTTFHVENISDGVDCVLNCDSKSISFCSSSSDAYLHLPILTSKVDRFSLLNSLPLAINFVKPNLSKQKKLLVCCHDGQDISICVCLAILTALFNERGSFDAGNSFRGTSITKWEMRKRLVFLCKFAVNAQPSRGNLKQVFAFLCREKDSWPSAAHGGIIEI